MNNDPPSGLAAPHDGKEPCDTTAPTGMGLILGTRVLSLVSGFQKSPKTPHSVKGTGYLRRALTLHSALLAQGGLLFNWRKGTGLG